MGAGPSSTSPSSHVGQSRATGSTTDGIGEGGSSKTGDGIGGGESDGDADGSASAPWQADKARANTAAAAAAARRVFMTKDWHGARPRDHTKGAARQRIYAPETDSAARSILQGRSVHRG